MAKIRTCSRCGYQMGSYDHFMAHRGKPVMAGKGRHLMAIKGHGFHAYDADDKANRAHKMKLW